MTKKVISKMFPNMHRLREHPQLLKIFGKIIHRQRLWHVNRYSVSRGVAIGLFCAFIPLPIQMAAAAMLAISLRAHIAIAVITVWISNPVTITPIFYFCYELGSLLLGTETGTFHFAFNWDWLKGGFLSVWQPLLLGCFIAAVISAATGYFAVRIYWRYYVISYWRRRSRL